MKRGEFIVALESVEAGAQEICPNKKYLHASPALKLKDNALQ